MIAKTKLRTFTTTIDPDLLMWLTLEAKLQNKTRRDIIEAALAFFKENGNEDPNCIYCGSRCRLPS